jgi:serine/threonine-protein phosphatase 6 regulatory ankyrin repeat subunit B
MMNRALMVAMLALTAPLCQAGDDISFKKLSLLLPDGGIEDAELVFMADQRVIAVRCLYHGGFRIPYDKVVGLVQSLTDRKVNTTAVALGGVAGLLFTKGKQHYLYINYQEDGAVLQIGLRLDKSEWQQVLDVAHAETGKTIETAGPAGPAPPPPPPLPATAGSAQPGVSVPIPTAATPESATLTIASVPSGADIKAGGEFLGSTPSTLKLEPGNYAIVVEKKGYVHWERGLRLSAGASIALDAELEPQAAVAAPVTPPVPVSAQVAEERPPRTLPRELTNSLGMRFIRIDPGSFKMGWKRYGPVHDVTLSKAFYLQTTEVTQAQWQAVMGTAPSNFKGPNRPVETVSWYDAEEFLHRLNAAEKVSHYRLPTEAEWEWACRADHQEPDRFPVLLMNMVAWSVWNSGGETHPVGSLTPNARGLFDMLGNVSEWVQDWKGPYPAEPQVDPQGPAAGEQRVVRGGDWATQYEDNCRCASRVYVKPGRSGFNLGFRCARTADESAAVAGAASTAANPPADDLISAANKGDLPRVKAFLDAKADVNARQANGSTALMLAALGGHQEVVRALLDAKADVNAHQNAGITALCMASINGHQEVARALIAAGANVNAKADKGVTALMLAAKTGRLEVVRVLLDAKADVNARTDDGGTALIAALDGGHQEVARTLLDAKADVNAEGSNGITALMAASRKGYQDVVRTLIAAGADVNAKAAKDLTALMLASFAGHQEVVRTLIDAKADVNAKMGNGDTALRLAAQNGHKEIVQLLKNAGAAGR